MMNRAFNSNLRRYTWATIWHDWAGEQAMWRLLHAAGRVNVCSL
jgi:hypothetical protein